MNLSLYHYPIFMILGVLFAPVEAANVDYSVDAGIGYSDNIQRVDNNPKKDSIRQIGGTLIVVDESSTNDFNLGVNVAYLDYRDDSFDDEVTAKIDLVSKWSLIDDSLTWDINGNYGQKPINPFVVTTPDNLQNTSLFSTGPDLIFRFTNADSLTLGYRYSNFYVEQTLDDYQASLFNVRLERRLSSLHTVSLNASSNDLDYESPLEADFRDYRYFISFLGNAKSTQYGLEWGIVEIEYDDGANAENDIKRLLFNRQVNRNNSFSIQVSETLDNNRGPNTTNILGVATAGLFVNETAQFTYNHTRNGFSLILGASYADQDYLDPLKDNLDQKVLGSSANLTYGLPVNLEIGVLYQHLDRDFYSIGQIDKEDTVTLRFEKQLTSDLNVELSFINFVRESTNQNDDAEENRVMLLFRHEGRI